MENGHSDMKITYLGTNTLLFSKGDSALLVDPHFTRPSTLRLLGKIRPDPQAISIHLTRAGIHDLDGILLTHTHYDHALDAAEVLRQTGGALYGSESALNLALGTDLDETSLVQVTPRQGYPIGAFQVSFHPSAHVSFPVPLGWLMPKSGQITQPLRPPARFWHYQCGKTFAIQVEHILIFGSAGFVDGAYQNLEIETVVLGIGGLDMKPKTYLHQLYREAVLRPGANQVLLSHWDNFFHPLDGTPRPMCFARRSIDRVRELGARYGQTIQLLEIGKPLIISKTA